MVVLRNRAARKEASAARRGRCRRGVLTTGKEAPATRSRSGCSGGCGMVVVVRRAAREKTSALGGSSDSAVVVVAVRKGHFGCFQKYVFIDHGGGIDV